MHDQHPAVIEHERSLPAVTSEDFSPVFEIQKAIERHNAVTHFTQQIMRENVDFGTIPGTDKPTLLKAGAEKLCTFFGLTSEFITTKEIEDWTGKEHGGEPLFYYRYKCRLSRNGRVMGEGEGSSNSWETKHRYRWVSAENLPAHLKQQLDALPRRDSSVTEFKFAVEKKETGGKYGKPAAYWQRFEEAMMNNTLVRGKKKASTGREMETYTIPNVVYRIPNPDAADPVNTLQKMAQKRAFVAAILITVNASEYFTQDVEDMEIIDVTPFKHVEPDKQPEKHPEQPATTETPKDANAATSRAAEQPTGAPAAADPTHSENPAPPPDPAAPTNDEARIDEIMLTFREAAKLADLTELFNRLPIAMRRPGTDVHAAFLKRRDELAAKKS